MVPVLVDGTFRLWESNAINQYLVEKAGGSPLFPRDPQIGADITRWQFWEQAPFNKAFGTLIFDVGDEPPGRESDQIIDAQRLLRWTSVFGTDRFAFGLGGWRAAGINAQLLGSGLPQEGEQDAWLDRRRPEVRWIVASGANARTTADDALSSN
jgi:glutathione S-transferase